MSYCLTQVSQKVERLRIYVSSATRPFSDADLTELIALSRQRNFEAGITGLLLYVEGSFIQAFEGPYLAVEELHCRIRDDSRHTNILDLVAVDTTRRSFPDWSMGLAQTSRSNLGAVDGISDYLCGGDLDSKLTDRRAWILLDHFRRTMGRPA